MLPRLNDHSFDTAIRSSQPILVTFTAPIRCPRCREQKPALEELRAEGVPVYVVDVENPDTRHIEATLGGRGVPFSKVYANGQLLVELLGLRDADGLAELFNEGAHLAAQMGSHRPEPIAPVYSAVAGGEDDYEPLPEPAAPAPVHPRHAGFRSLRGLLSGFGRE